MPRRPPRLPPLLAEFDDDEREAVLTVNRAFYRAFNERDYDALDTLWAPTGSLICLHPGQAPLYDRAAIMASWKAIVQHPQSPRARHADEWVFGKPGLAIVVCREILPTAQLMATNTFVRLGDGWKMIGHHSGPAPTSNRARPVATGPLRDRRKLH